LHPLEKRRLVTAHVELPTFNKLVANDQSAPKPVIRGDEFRTFVRSAYAAACWRTGSGRLSFV
jgi:hypothetical protein